MKTITRFFFINILTQEKLLLLKRKKCARKIANACFFEKKALQEGVFAKLCDDLRRIFIKRIKMSSIYATCKDELIKLIASL